MQTKTNEQRDQVRELLSQAADILRSGRPITPGSVVARAIREATADVPRHERAIGGAA